MGGDDGPYRVTIDAARTTVCADECVELTARAENGHAPYSYAWADELGEGAGPHQACPEQTTTYSVVVEDTGFEDEEFGRPSKEVGASIEIRVDEACEAPDGGSVGPRTPTYSRRPTRFSDGR